MQSQFELLEPRRLLAADLLADVGGIYPTESLTLNGIAYFAANDGLHGKELWKSDGTQAGTEMVADITPGPEGSAPRDFVVVNGQVVFFTVQEGELTLWVTNGTEPGTTKLHEFGTTYHPSANIAVLDDGARMVFTVSVNDENGSTFDLWTSDGTAGGTTLVQSFSVGGQAAVSDPALWSGDHFHLPVAGGRAMFTSGNHLWATDGTVGGTVDLSAAIPSLAGEPIMHLNDLIPYGGNVLVTREDGTGTALWRTDGTVGGTALVKSLGEGTTGFTNATAGGKVFIVQVVGNGKKLWVSDGTSAGTQLLFESDGWSPAHLPSRVGNSVVFHGTDPTNGHELWVSDGTVAGTHLLKDLTPGPDESFFMSFQAIGSFTYFLRLVGQDENGNGGHRQLWRTDGTAAGTVMLQENMEPTGVTAGHMDLTVVDNRLVVRIYTNGVVTPELRVLDPDTMSVPAGPATSRMTVTDRVLRIFGTKSDDSIRIYQIAGNANRFAVNLNGVKQSFAFADVRKVLVFGYSGNDNIAFSYVNGAFVLRSMIQAGSGNDSIYGGATRDSIWGDEGDDFIHASASHDMAFGGDGDDVLLGVGGDDTLDGQNGSDEVDGGGGADLIAGGNDEGSDSLDGGGGVDVIFGRSVIEIFFQGEQGSDPLDEILIL